MTKMNDFLTTPHAVETILQPETGLEKHLLTVPEFRRGLLWGEPRFGHPEGKVVWHVREVLGNINLIPRIPAAERERLRLVAMAHDTFKYMEDRRRPRDWSKHHGVLARRFMEQYTNDTVVLDLIEAHDDAYYAWMNEREEREYADNNRKSLDSLLRRVSHWLQFYYLFFKCDTQTGDKNQAPLKWWENTVQGIEVLKIREMAPKRIGMWGRTAGPSDDYCSNHTLLRLSASPL